ncbi:hypothetical protein [Polaribacter sp. MED152]|uniref:hypothetical protein n=1 Tax=Polaribacter sp. MED152 TaxID=313598 RepID=UPI000068CC57|nr:hypothetical protein [Polaribacter sp. MED152]EAQ41481.1 hypothetical protein MED152_02165 [Polaribacter sp. MED152]
MTKYFNHFAAFIVTLTIFSCSETNWEENFNYKEKSPFGTYIMHEEINNLFPNDSIITIKKNFRDYLADGNFDSISTANYVCINYSMNKLEYEGVDSLLSFVSKGNNAFIALEYFSKNFRKKLEFTSNNLSKDSYFYEDLKKLKGQFYLDSLRTETYNFDRNIKRNYFVTYNKNNTSILGFAEIDTELVPNFIRIKHGKGYFYLHTNPIVFTNYYLLKDENSYINQLLSYLPSGNIIWDPQLRYSKNSDNNKDNTSVFDFFLKHNTLTWFLIVLLVGILLFMLFNAKRKQRPIPSIPKLENTTVAFTQTIASLYLKEQNHKNLVDKTIRFFLEKVRTKYLLNTNRLNTEFIKNLASKSGNKLANTKYLINTIKTLNKKTECTQEELFVLQKMITKFLKK